MQSCKLIVGFEMVTCRLVLTTCAIFSAMRVYVVCNRNKLVLAFIVAVVLIHPVITTVCLPPVALLLRTLSLMLAVTVHLHTTFHHHNTDSRRGGVRDHAAD